MAEVKLPILSSADACRWDADGPNCGLVSDVFSFRPSDLTVRSVVTTADTQTLTNKTLTSPTITSPTITGGSGIVLTQTALFTEDATNTLHQATFALPAGSMLLDIIVVPQVLWTATGAVSLEIGDSVDADGWFTAVDLKATDLILGEKLQASSDNFWGGKNGVYLTTAGRFGQQTTNMIGGYCVSAYSLVASVTVGTPATTAGRTRVTVLYTTGSTVTPVSSVA